MLICVTLWIKVTAEVPNAIISCFRKENLHISPTALSKQRAALFFPAAEKVKLLKAQSKFGFTKGICKCVSNINMGGLPTTGLVVQAGLFEGVQPTVLYTCCC